MPRHTREFYCSVISNSTDLLSVLDEEGNYQFVGGSVRSILGYEPEELLGANAFTFIHPEDLTHLLSLEEVLESTQKKLSPFRFKAKSGEWRWIECTATNMLHSEHVQGIVTNSRDITAAVELAYQNDYHQAYYESLFFEHPDAVFTLNQNGEFQQVNQHVETLTGYPEAETLGASYASFVHPDSLEIAQQSIERIWAGEAHTVELCLTTRTGDARSVSISVMPVYFRGELLGAQGIAKDITVQNNIQREMEKLSFVASKTINGVVIMDPEGKIEWVNDGFCRLTGYSRHEVVGKVPSVLLQGPDTSPEASERIRRKYQAQKPFSEEILNYTKSGERLWFYIDVTPTFDQDGRLESFIAIQTDVTEKKGAEAKLVKLADDLYKQNLDLQQFTYIISHNLRAPVANALGLMQLVKKLPKAAANYDAAMERLYGSINQLDSVVKDINQALSIRDTGQISPRETVHLAQVCQEVLHHFRDELETNRAEVQVDIDAAYSLQSIRSYLYSILYNLVSNSIKYKSDKRRLHLAITAERDKRGYVLTVRDNGSGMDMHLVEHQLFQLYKRFHPNTHGKGVGLFLVKTQVQALSGKIKVESAPDEGTTFRVYLGAKHV